ncbi:MAG: hypothetical protein AB7E70_09895 [Hyphomicrobiaceae bacterium]
MLSRISSQISDADRRHSEALTEMARRLARLGNRTEQAREQAPTDCREAIDRIGHSVARLAERLDDAGRERELAAQHAPLADVDGDVFARPPFNWRRQEEDEEHSAAATTPAPDLEPMQALADTPAAATPASHEPWDRESADALMRIYYPDAGQQPAAAAPVAAVAAAQPVEAAVPAPQPIAIDFGAERAWLDSRLADVAHRIEASLAEMRPESALDSLSQRFETFENRFGSALDGVARKADVEALSHVEGYINELAAHLEQTEIKLARIDALEAHLTQLLEQVSEPRLAKLIASVAPAQLDIESIAHVAAEKAAEQFARTPAPPQPDFTSLANRTADIVAERLASTARPDPANEAVEQRVVRLQDMLQTFIAERRQGEQQTTDSLDTVHSALLELVGRVEAIESLASTQPEPAQAPGRPTPTPAPAPMSSLDPRLAAPAQPASPPPGAGDGPTLTHTPAGPAEMPRGPAALRRPARHGRPLAGDAPLPEPSGPMLSLEPQAEPGPDTEGSREDFVSAARRAAKQASIEAAAEQSRIEAQTPSPKAGRRSVKMFAGERSSVSPLMMVSGVVLLAASAAFLYGTLKPRAPQAPQAQLQPEPAPKAMPQGSMLPSSAVPGARPQVPDARTQAPDARTQAPLADPKPALTPAPVPGPQSRTQPVSPEPAQLPGKPSRPDIVPETTFDRLKYPGAKPAAPQPPATRGIFVQPFSPGLQQQPGLQQATPAPQAPVERAAIKDVPTPPVVKPRSGAPVELALPPPDIGPLSLRIAAAKGDPSAEFEIAARFAEGKGVTQDFREAHAWYQRAATRGFAPAQYRLATLFERGVGVAADLSRARIWYGRAAEQGHVKAMHNLAVLSASGAGGKPDYAAAAVWFSKAAEHGLPDSQFNLAILHENGLGVGKDLVQALKWFSLAAKRGDAEAGRRRDRLRVRLSAAQQKAAQRLIGVWRSRPVDRTVNDPLVAGQAWKSRSAQR